MEAFIEPLLVLPRNVAESGFTDMADRQHLTHFHHEIFETEEEAIDSCDAKNATERIDDRNVLRNDGDFKKETETR
jgi:hypothetical protein